jgi:diguanylate cyclase (GGDEF)-like protein/PAS domain S-box-containing protein
LGVRKGQAGLNRQSGLVGYVAWMTALVIAHYALSGLRIETWALIGLSGVLAVVAGMQRNRPARKAPWLLLAAANLCWITAQLVQLITTGVPPWSAPFRPFAATLYLLGYPLCVLGFLFFIRRPDPDGGRRSTIDALIMTLGLAMLVWIYLIRPYEASQAESVLHKTLDIAYPVGDLAILGMLARLLAPGTARGRAVVLLAIGTIGDLASNLAMGVMHAYPALSGAAVIDLGWAVCYAAWGAAALDPSMVNLTCPAGKRSRHLEELPGTAWGRLLALLITALIPPAFLFIRSFLVVDAIERTVAAVCWMLFVLVSFRLWDVNVSHRRALGRERALRQAGAALASAASVDSIGEIVRGAVRRLTGHRSQREALLVVRVGDGLEIVATASGELVPRTELAGLAGTWLPELRQMKSTEPRLIPAARLDPRERALAEQAGFESLLLLPLTLSDRPTGDPLIGMLAILGEERVLGDLSSALGILASQVALALERVTLSQEVIRQRGEALFRTLVQDALDVILVLADDGTIKYASPSATRLWGDVPIEGGNAGTLTADRKRLSTQTADTPKAGEQKPGEQEQDPYSGLWRIKRHDGRELLVEVRHIDLRDDETVRGQVLTVRDVTEQHQLAEELTYQAFHDPLTGLPNRTLFADRAAHGIALAKRHGTTAAVLFVDLDDFKVINDTMGHAVGDELLVVVAQRLAAVVRESDTAARLGGDEFALLIENLSDPSAVDTFANRVVAAFSEPFELSSGAVLATATVGVATTEDSSNVDQLLRHADLSLYAAKSDGKRQWHRYRPVLSAGMVKRRELQAALEETVTKSAFNVAYQPIVRLASGEIRGFEALARWPDPVRGTVPPSEFIELAEETGLIVPLGSWVLRQAITDLARWRGSDPSPRQPSVSVNVSARQFRDPGFVGLVRRCLDETGLVSSALMLELTESALLRRDDRINSDLAELKHMGVGLAIDDFGTGYSSLSYLKELPIDVLKIDKTFVDAIVESSTGRRFAELIINFARELGIQVTAEGIETDEQRELLTAMGCEYGQGYLLAMPMDWRSAEKLLRSGRSFARDGARRASSW